MIVCLYAGEKMKSHFDVASDKAICGLELASRLGIYERRIFLLCDFLSVCSDSAPFQTCHLYSKKIHTFSSSPAGRRLSRNGKSIGRSSTCIYTIYVCIYAASNPNFPDQQYNIISGNRIIVLCRLLSRMQSRHSPTDTSRLLANI